MSELVNVIFKKGVLFDINIGKWAAQHRMTPEDLMMEKVNAEAMHIGFKRLMPSKAMKPIIHLEGKIRSFVDKMSMPFPIAGAVFVNYKMLKPLVQGLKSYSEDYQEAAQELVEHYDEYREAQLSVLDAEAEKIAYSRRKNPSDALGMGKEAEAAQPLSLPVEGGIASEVLRLVEDVQGKSSRG